jgi:tetratricopeptide (TPR) repeat protein
VLAELSREDEAVRQWQRAIELDPDCAPAYTNLAIVLLRRGELDAAASNAERALKADPTVAHPHFALGLIAKSRGRLDDAKRHFSKALRLSPCFKPAQEELKAIDGG